MPKIHNIYFTVDIARTKDERCSIIDIHDKFDITIAAISMTSGKMDLRSKFSCLKYAIF